MALAFLRKYQRDVLLKALLGIVIVGFVLVYIPMFVQGSAAGRADEVGRVGDIPISATEYQRIYSQQRRRFESYGMDAAMARKFGLPDQVFDALVDDKVVQLEAKRRGLTVSDQELARHVATMPSLQENGRFVGAQRAQRAIEAQWPSVEEFENSLRSDLLRQQLEALVTDGITVSPAEVEDAFKRQNEQIKAEFVLVDATPFKAQVSVTDDEVRAHFEGHKDSYRIPETRVVDYVRVDDSVVKPLITVTDAEIDAYYKSHSDEFSEPEQVCARHILYKVKGEGSPDGHSGEEAASLAAQTLQHLRAGADFATVAQKSSEDKGSAANGGSLGCFTRNKMVPEFENAAFELKPGELSDIVKTQYGYHIIRVDKRMEPTTKPLDAVREAIRGTLTTTKGSALADSKTNAIADALAHGKKLEEAVASVGLSLKTSPPLARGAAMPPFDAHTSARIFELKPGDPPQSLPGGLFASLKQVNPPRTPELAEVKDQVKAELVEAKAMEQARTRAADLRSKAASVGLEKAATAAGLTRKETKDLVHHDQPLGDLPPGAALDQAAFALPLNTLSDPIPVTGGYAVLRVLEKKTFDPATFEKQKASMEASERQKKRREFFEAYLAQVRQRFAVEKHADVLRRIVG
jgi:peptidyl-prolyl cis-trans isomerase D